MTIDKMLTPANALTVTFYADGKLKIERMTRKAGGGYPSKPTLVDSYQVAGRSAQDTINFEFALDDQQPDSAALFVEMASDWPDVPWNDDAVAVFGGREQFPVGNGPLGIPAGNAAVPRVRVKRGVFTNVDQNNPKEGIQATSQLTLFGVRKTTHYQLGTVPTRVFSVWFPDGVKGHVKFSPWNGADKIISSTENPAKTNRGATNK
jgi:hypothetical protein